MGNATRLNLTIPEEIDRVISDVAKASGQTKTAVIMSALREYLPHWRRWVRDMGVEDLEPAAASSEPDPDESHLTRQQRRALARERAKGR